ncbi:hypothetical protein LC608_21750, partial [Nostoc sp. XA010]|uniref:hypothetical protein n=1 Tax=Nostoc sp. XA010 TaxID=2780407 RepID=UPI001E5C0156
VSRLNFLEVSCLALQNFTANLSPNHKESKFLIISQKTFARVLILLSIEDLIIYFPPNRFDVNIKGLSGLLNGDFLLMLSSSFAANFEIIMLLLAAHSEAVLSGRR